MWSSIGLCLVSKIFFDSTLNILKVPSQEPHPKYYSSGEKARQATASLNSILDPLILSKLLFTFHNITELSLDPDAKYFPDFENYKVITAFLCPSNYWIGFIPLKSLFQIFIVLLGEAVAKILLFGEKSMAFVEKLLGSITNTFSHASTYKWLILTKYSFKPIEAIVFESFKKVAHRT